MGGLRGEIRKVKVDTSEEQTERKSTTVLFLFSCNLLHLFNQQYILAMKLTIVQLVKRVFGVFGLKIMRESTYAELKKISRRNADWRVGALVEGDLDKGLGSYASKQEFKDFRSQLGQD